jgi:hypothetical protein
MKQSIEFTIRTWPRPFLSPLNGEPIPPGHFLVNHNLVSSILSFKCVSVTVIVHICFSWILIENGG